MRSHPPKFNRAEQASHLQILTQQLHDTLRHHEQEIKKLQKIIRIAEKSIRLLNCNEGETVASISDPKEKYISPSTPTPTPTDMDDPLPVADIFTKPSRSQISLLTSPPSTPPISINTYVKNNITTVPDLRLTSYEFAVTYGIQQLTSPPSVGQTIVVIKPYKSTTDNLSQDGCLGIITSFQSTKNKSRVNIRLGKDRRYVKQWTSLGTLTKNLSIIPSRFK